jgi:hypothetical protein
MATARDLIKGSLRLIGAIAAGETPSAAEQADALSTLNEMLDSWSLERLAVPARIREEFAVSTSPVTMGSGADLDTARPIRIEAAAVMINNVEHPIEVVGHDEWSEIKQKSLTSTLPTHLYPQGTTPLETINLWPMPSGSVTLVLYSWKALSQLATATSDVELPNGYLRALRYNLAIELAPEYGKVASAEIAKIAKESKENIKRANKRPIYMTSDAFGLNDFCGRTFEWEIGE